MGAWSDYYSDLVADSQAQLRAVMSEIEQSGRRGQ
jgi:hypothetical protein